MKFTISYKAEWGESLHADITFFARDGKWKVVDLAPILSQEQTRLSVLEWIFLSKQIKCENTSPLLVIF